MYYTAGNMIVPTFFEGGLVGFGQPEGLFLPTATLLFSPVRVVLLIIWVYLCLYSIQQIEFGSLVSRRHKAIANAFSLLIGPLLLFVLFVADITRQFQEGSITFDDILRRIFGNIFHWENI